MLLQSPPAEIHLAGLFDHYAEALKAAKANNGRILGLLLRSPQEHQAAMDFLRTLPGVRLRADLNVWFPESTEIDAELKATKAPKHTGSELVSMDSKGQDRTESLIGSSQDLVTVLTAVSTDLDQGQKQRPDLTGLKQANPSIPNLDQFLVFGDARLQDPAAAAKEPFRSWLVSLLKEKPDSDLGHWAAFRLVEAGATLNQEDPNPVPIVMLDCRVAMSRGLGVNNEPDSPYLFGWEALGRLKDISNDAPYLTAFRVEMAKSPKAFASDLYGFIARHLSKEDRPWILECWKAASVVWPTKSDSVEKHAVYWVTADWLLAYGNPEDWQTFLSAANSPGWAKPLASLMSRVQKIPTYWDRDANRAKEVPILQPDVFWHSPEPLIKELGLGQSSLDIAGVSYPSLKSEPFFPPSYPAKATEGFRIYRGTIQIRNIVGHDGRVSGIYPVPGYGLHLFAPDLLDYMSRLVFTPASVGGKPLACPYIYRWSFVAIP